MFEKIKNYVNYDNFRICKKYKFSIFTIFTILQKSDNYHFFIIYYYLNF